MLNGCDFRDLWRIQNHQKEGFSSVSDKENVKSCCNLKKIPALKETFFFLSSDDFILKSSFALTD